MQGTLSIVRFPLRALVASLIAAAVLILAAAGGYWLRSQASAAPLSKAPQVVVAQSGSGSMSGAAFDQGARRSGTQY